jgi:hypothetical protein
MIKGLGTLSVREELSRHDGPDRLDVKYLLGGIRRGCVPCLSCFESVPAFLSVPISPKFAVVKFASELTATLLQMA